MKLVKKIPSDIKLTLSSGTLTLASGSVITSPDGTQVKTTQDYSITRNVNGEYYVFSAKSNGSVQTPRFVSRVSSGPILPIDNTNYEVFLNTSDLIIYRWYNNQWTGWGVTLPIAIITVSGGAISKINKTFNGFGYMGNSLFALPNVRMLVPDGRDIDGNPQYLDITNTSLIVRDGYNGKYSFLTSKNGKFNGLMFSDSFGYNNVANLFYGSKSATAFYYNYTYNNYNVEPVADIRSVPTISQYANSLNYVNLFYGLTYLMNNAETLEDWYNVVFNIKTASGFGLDIWGKILNIGRALRYTSGGSTINIYLSGKQTIDGVTYSAAQIEEIYRQMLFLGAMSNISNATLNSLNELMLFYYQDRGLAYFVEYGNMKIRLVYDFYVTKLEQAIFGSGIIPKPAGVLLTIEYIPLGENFGFFVDGEATQPFAPFDNKPFYW